MGSSGRIAIFVTVVLTLWTLFHLLAYRLIWSLPQLNSAVTLPWRVTLFTLLWLSYPLGRTLSRTGAGRLGVGIEGVGAVWMGVLFFLLVAFLAADLLTGFGFLFPKAVVPVRMAALTTGLLFSILAVLQFLRGPRIVEHEVHISNLPLQHEGLRIIQISDLHLGTLLGESWLKRRIDQVSGSRPGLIFITGDLVDSDIAPVRSMVPLLRKLTAPLGIYGVTGNHEFYAGLAGSLEVMDQAGIKVLRDSWTEVAPGLVVAGVDDLTARRQFGVGNKAVERAFRGAPSACARILLSHSPLEVEEAERQGAGLMLSGHTHGGQIWPFTYLSAIPYPFQAGRYQVGGMTLLVSRGTGTWGPPMRLFFRSEILAITLRRELNPSKV